MSVGLIPPMLEVVHDQQVTIAEVSWYIQTALLVTITAVLTTAFWELAEEGVEW